MLPLDLLVGALLTLDMPRDAHVSRSDTRQAVCSDPLADLLARTGWHGNDNRTAWAIAMRESNGQSDVISGGAYGLFQLQADVWEGTDIWPDDWSDPAQNARAAHTLWQRSGWRPWGITSDGASMDVRDYAGWDSATQWSWIWEPYQQWRDAYPCEVAP